MTIFSLSSADSLTRDMIQGLVCTSAGVSAMTVFYCWEI